MTGLMDRSLVVRLGSLAVVRKRAGRGSFAKVAAGAAKDLRIRGPGRALSSNACAMVDYERLVLRFVNIMRFIVMQFVL